MTRHRAGVVGAGLAGDTLVQALKHAGVDIAYVWDDSLFPAQQLIDRHALKEARATVRYEDVLHDDSVDIVAVATPPFQHKDALVAAAAYRKDLIVDKPAVRTLEELVAVVDAVRRSGVRSTTLFPHRAGEHLRQVKQCVVNGLIGKPFLTEVGFVIYAQPSLFEALPWLRSAGKAGDAMVAEGIHAVDLVRWLATTGPEEEATVVEVQAMSGQVRRETDYPDLCVALLRFADGTLGQVGAHLSTRGRNVPPATVFGAEGTIRGNDLWSEVLPEPRGWLRLPAPLPGFERSVDRYARRVAGFIRALDEGRTPECGIESTINTHEACFAAAISAREGRPVRLPLQRW